VDSKWKAFAALFRGETDIAVDRALAELRAGRPIVIESSERASVAAAVDAISPTTVDEFARLGSGNTVLALSLTRAHALGLPAVGPIAIAMAVLDQDDILQLACASDAIGPEHWVPADATAVAGIDLCKHALLLPAILLARGDLNGELPKAIHRVNLDQIERLHSRERHLLEIISRARVPLAESVETSFVVFRGGPGLRDQVAIVVGNPDPTEPVLVRLHSACLTGDLFGSLRCDCGDQLRKAISCLATQGGGVLLYLDQEGRGTGIRNKMRAYALQDSGLDTIDADAVLGYGVDERRYEIAVSMLLALGYGRVRLVTNNPDKVDALRNAGIDVVGRLPLLGAVTAENQHYLATKAKRAGHLLNDFADVAQPAKSA
jgi:GTP cyclohydrolase II